MSSSKTSGYDQYHDQTLQNTLANRGTGNNQQLKVRPVTRYSSIIPPPSPTYFSLPETARKHPTGNLTNGTGGDRGELAHLQPLPVDITPDEEEQITWYQKASIWMINEGKNITTVARNKGGTVALKAHNVGATMHHVCAIFNPPPPALGRIPLQCALSPFVFCSGLQGVG